MSDYPIRTRNLGKSYFIGDPAGVLELRESLAQILRKPRAAKAASIWALRDVTFEVEAGEVIGIIGRNGAGKSTLLKILSRITEPTEGWAETVGTLNSLLEIGTGFHPDLTGRENVYLSGVLLGMSRAEVKRRFDEIIAFAEVEQFVDTPIRHYSSGMQMRLAFAVAAHLDARILLIDEVLAVGDIAFQKKCLGRMSGVAESGRTILFVSHQLNQIRRLCSRTIWLEEGRIKAFGPTSETVSAYEASQATGRNDAGEGEAPDRFLGWEILEPRGEKPNVLETRASLTLSFRVHLSQPLSNGHHGIALSDTDGRLIWAAAVYNLDLHAGINSLIYKLPGLPLRPGAYYWQVSLYDETRLIDLWHCHPEILIAREPTGHRMDKYQGILDLCWEFETR